MRAATMVRLSRLARAVVVACMACLGCGGSDGPASPPDGGSAVTVSGTVVDSCLRPAADVIVWIRNRGVTRTDASGRFSFSDVQPPYEIATLEGPANDELIRVYAGLTAAEARLKLKRAPAAAPRQGALEGTFSVGTGSTAIIPVPLDRRTWFSFTPTENTPSGGSMDDANPYHLDASWCGAASVTGTFEALQWTTQANPNLAETFHAYGRAMFPASDGMTLSGQDLSLDSVGTSSLSGAITPPTGLVLIGRTVGLDPGPGIDPKLWFNFTQATNGIPSQFTVAVPDAPDLRLGIAAEASGEGLGTAESWLRGIVPGTPVSVGMDPVPTQVSPQADVEVELATQTFSWESPVNGVQSLYAPLFVPPAVGPSRSLKYEVFTLARSVRLPLPQELGLSALPPGTKGEWHVGSSNEPSLARLTSPSANVRFGGGVLGVVLPIPEAAEVRFATALAITTFTLR